MPCVCTATDSTANPGPRPAVDGAAPRAGADVHRAAAIRSWSSALCPGTGAAHGAAKRPSGTVPGMTQGMVSAPQPEAVEAGLEALEAGGNAIDAAIATALVQTVVDPQMCGIAGFGNLHVYLPGQNVHTTLDFHGRSPLAVRPDMWADLIEREAEDGWGFILKGRVNELGYGAISTPRTLAALDEALNRWGTRPLAELLEPAIAYCEDGFAVRPHVWQFWHEPAAAPDTTRTSVWSPRTAAPRRSTPRTVPPSTSATPSQPRHRARCCARSPNAA